MIFYASHQTTFHLCGNGISNSYSPSSNLYIIFNNIRTKESARKKEPSCIQGFIKDYSSFLGQTNKLLDDNYNILEADIVNLTLCFMVQHVHIAPSLLPIHEQEIFLIHSSTLAHTYPRKMKSSIHRKILPAHRQTIYSQSGCSHLIWHQNHKNGSLVSVFF